MVEQVLFRQEAEGGYRFDRETGKVFFFETEQFADEVMAARQKKENFDFVPLPSNASRIALSAPLAIWHETTHSCNLNCKNCGRARTEESEMNLEEIEGIYKEIASNGVFEVRVTGGEACVRHDIEHIVNSAKIQGLYVSLTSNGVYSDELRERIVALPVGLFIISLDGTQEINDSIRGQGTYESTMKTIKSLTQRRRNVRVNAILMKKNKDCIEELVETLEKAGVSALTLTPLRPAGEAVKEFYESKLTPEQYKAVVMKVNELREKHKGFSLATNYDILSETTHASNVPSHWSKMCIAGIEAACISPSGNLRACILYAGEGTTVGNLKHQRFKELWHNDDIWGIFRDPDRRVLQQCRECPNYTVKCPGSCLAMTEFSKSPEEIYCFKDIN